MTTKTGRAQVMDFFLAHTTTVVGQRWHEEEIGDCSVDVWIQSTIANIFFQDRVRTDILIQSLSRNGMLLYFLFVLETIILAKVKVACI